MVYVGGNLETSIGNVVGRINPTYLKYMGMFLMIISVICVVAIIMDIFKKRQNVTISTVLNAAMYLSAFVAGFYLWKPRM